MLVKNLSTYSFGGFANLEFDETVKKVTEVLREEGFGILTEIDAQKVMKEKLEINRKPYKILGACNPNYAHKAIDIEPNIGTLLPCNILIYENDNNEVVVSAMNPEAALNLVDNPEIESIAKVVRNKITAALGRV